MTKSRHLQVVDLNEVKISAECKDDFERLFTPDDGLGGGLGVKSVQDVHLQSDSKGDYSTAIKTFSEVFLADSDRKYRPTREIIKEMCTFPKGKPEAAQLLHTSASGWTSAQPPDAKVQDAIADHIDAILRFHRLVDTAPAELKPYLLKREVRKITITKWAAEKDKLKRGSAEEAKANQDLLGRLDHNLNIGSDVIRILSQELTGSPTALTASHFEAKTETTGIPLVTRATRLADPGLNAVAAAAKAREAKKEEARRKDEAGGKYDNFIAFIEGVPARADRYTNLLTFLKHHEDKIITKLGETGEDLDEEKLNEALLSADPKTTFTDKLGIDLTAPATKALFDRAVGEARGAEYLEKAPKALKALLEHKEVATQVKAFFVTHPDVKTDDLTEGFQKKVAESKTPETGIETGLALFGAKETKAAGSSSAFTAMENDILAESAIYQFKRNIEKEFKDAPELQKLLRTLGDELLKTLVSASRPSVTTKFQTAGHIITLTPGFFQNLLVKAKTNEDVRKAFTDNLGDIADILTAQGLLPDGATSTSLVRGEAVYEIKIKDLVASIAATAPELKKVLENLAYRPGMMKHFSTHPDAAIPTLATLRAELITNAANPKSVFATHLGITPTDEEATNASVEAQLDNLIQGASGNLPTLEDVLKKHRAKIFNHLITPGNSFPDSDKLLIDLSKASTPADLKNVLKQLGLADTDLDDTAASKLRGEAAYLVLSNDLDDEDEALAAVINYEKNKPDIIDHFSQTVDGGKYRTNLRVREIQGLIVAEKDASHKNLRKKLKDYIGIKEEKDAPGVLLTTDSSLSNDEAILKIRTEARINILPRSLSPKLAELVEIHDDIRKEVKSHFQKEANHLPDLKELHLALSQGNRDFPDDRIAALERYLGITKTTLEKKRGRTTHS